MADELLDLVDENDNVIGEVWMSKAHKDPSLLHREVAIAVFNKKREVLLQRRGFKKRIDPGIWTITAAGHVGRGEDPKSAAKRELEEEMGIDVEPIFLAKVFWSRETEARFFWVYYAILEKDQEVKPNEEVEDTRWIKVDELEEFSRKNNYSLQGGSHEMIIQAYDRIRSKWLQLLNTAKTRRR